MNLERVDMSLIYELSSIIEDSRAAFKEIMSEVEENTGDRHFIAAELVNTHDKERFDGATLSHGENLVAMGDNIVFMEELLKRGFKGKLALIYIDPPFFSKANYDAVLRLYSEKLKGSEAIKVFAYNDIWEHGLESYLRMLTIRFLIMKELLSDDGCFWIHLDWHVVHYVKIILDEIFGEKNFVNEVIWQYKSGGTSKRHYSRKHDTLLFYAKTDKYYFTPQTEKSYNRGYKPYRFKGVKEFKDETGWYTQVNMKDVWQLDMVGRTSAERTGYATQKPESLLERIIQSCSKPDDICADFFGGSGTLAAVANRMGRKFISCDSGTVASVSSVKRLAGAGASFAFCMADPGKSTGQASGLEVSAEVSPIELSDKWMLEIELKKYSPANREFPTDEKGKNILSMLIKEDSLSLIEYWSIDFDYDGVMHKADVLLARDKNHLETRFRKIAKNFGRISIVAVDAFGNRYYREFDPSGKNT